MIIRKAGSSDIAAIKAIFKNYQTALNEPVCFANFEKELDKLLGLYQSPTGVVLLAFDTDVIGCVALRPLIENDKPSPKVAELKRLYVKDSFKGKSIGKRLLKQVLDESKNLGYESVVLETMDKMEQATQLYLKFGFKEIPAYFANADENVKFYRYDNA